MADVLSGPYHFASKRGERYPVETWFDGQTRRLRNGQDFSVKPQSLLNNLRKIAESQGLVLDYRIEDERTVVIRARKQSQ